MYTRALWQNLIWDTALYRNPVKDESLLEMEQNDDFTAWNAQ